MSITKMSITKWLLIVALLWAASHAIGWLWVLVIAIAWWLVQEDKKEELRLSIPDGRVAAERRTWGVKPVVVKQTEVSNRQFWIIKPTGNPSLGDPKEPGFTLSTRSGRLVAQHEQHGLTARQVSDFLHRRAGREDGICLEAGNIITYWHNVAEYLADDTEAKLYRASGTSVENNQDESMYEEEQLLEDAAIEEYLARSEMT